MLREIEVHDQAAALAGAIAVEKLPRRAESGDREAGGAQRGRDRVADRLVVVDEEDQRVARGAGRRAATRAAWSAP